MKISTAILLVLVILCQLLGCTKSATTPHDELLVATTTSTRDSGLIDRLTPVFEKKYSIKIRWIAVGTGKALELGRLGEVDAILVHSESDELEFMEQGHGVRREPIMYNYFELLGPPADPAGIRDQLPPLGLKRIRESEALMVSRGDQSGTHKREQFLWNLVGGSSEWEGRVETGQGMGESLVIADQKQAYILCDRGTYLSMRSKIQLVPLAQKSVELRNPYGFICIAPQKNDRINRVAADQLADFLISPMGQAVIANHQVDNEPLFHPLRDGRK